ncbi:hypothetical protein So717_35310 [Roseobacter cerasinus]|uniref:Uncharacterized protein n=1 Tax=Roseobacter cerasinus TaxID=2602289 RepID=A0A640VTR7_9RHOB|nr:hypothetical protein [Roseobacter cerasinus]GFE51778.1 hypothetical protein So717_35310 [Roseobacter cerasinus]
MSPTCRTDEHVSKIQARLSQYLDKLSAQIFDVEETIGQSIGLLQSPDAQTITNLQALDFVRQSLEDLALMLLLLSQSEKSVLNASDLCKLSEKLKLEATRAILDGDSKNYSDQTSNTPEDLDLF